MANTTLVSGKTIQITGLDADWYIDNDMPGYEAGLAIESIEFDPSANSDVMVIKNSKAGTAASAKIFNQTVDAAVGVSDQRIKYFDKDDQLYPFIDISDCTLGSAAAATVTFNLR